MLESRGAHELGFAGTAIIIQLLQHLIDENVLKREQVLRLVGQAADDLVRDRKRVSDVHVLASRLIREDLVPRI